jgi:hypothetical protein
MTRWGSLGLVLQVEGVRDPTTSRNDSLGPALQVDERARLVGGGGTRLNGGGRGGGDGGGGGGGVGNRSTRV